MRNRKGDKHVATAINFVVKHDFNIGGAHEDKRSTKKKKDKHKKDLRYED